MYTLCTVFKLDDECEIIKNDICEAVLACNPRGIAVTPLANN